MQSNPWEGQRVLITGVCGTVGRELLRQVSNRNPAEIVGIDNNESELFFVKEEYRNKDNTHFYLCDLRNANRVRDVSRGVDIILHSAAFKHVILCEQSPREAVYTNILGTQNIIDAAQANEVKRVIYTSSDKAVNPTNVMGTSKLMGERLMTSANAHQRNSGPIFASTRFGNVLGSRGSVIPLFKKQIKSGGPVTLTDDRMTRFIMTLEQAVHLVMESVFLARGGEVFITKMPIIRIEDLAHSMITELSKRNGFDKDVEIEIIGSKAGEKLYEELMNEEETRRTVDLPEFFVVLPAFQAIYNNINYEYPNMKQVGVDQSYTSRNGKPMSQNELSNFLNEHKLLD
ncbi:MAG TPA: polysaccharide biosynthesis protein [Bacteroidales bacterium]|nr:polysaccharide biosynthesis protein [Bacteroidales bacterium]